MVNKTVLSIVTQGRLQIVVFFFSPTSSQKPKDCLFTIINEEEKMQILTLKQLDPESVRGCGTTRGWSGVAMTTPIILLATPLASDD